MLIKSYIIFILFFTLFLPLESTFIGPESTLISSTSRSQGKSVKSKKHSQTRVKRPPPRVLQKSKSPQRTYVLPSRPQYVTPGYTTPRLMPLEEEVIHHLPPTIEEETVRVGIPFIEDETEVGKPYFEVDMGPSPAPPQAPPQAEPSAPPSPSTTPPEVIIIKEKPDKKLKGSKVKPSGDDLDFLGIESTYKSQCEKYKTVYAEVLAETHHYERIIEENKAAKKTFEAQYAQALAKRPQGQDFETKEEQDLIFEIKLRDSSIYNYGWLLKSAQKDVEKYKNLMLNCE